MDFCETNFQTKIGNFCQKELFIYILYLFYICIFQVWPYEGKDKVDLLVPPQEGLINDISKKSDH